MAKATQYKKNQPDKCIKRAPSCSLYLKCRHLFMSSVLQLWKLLVELHVGIVCHPSPNHSPKHFQQQCELWEVTKQHVTLGMNLQSLCRNFLYKVHHLIIRSQSFLYFVGKVNLLIFCWCQKCWKHHQSQLSSSIVQYSYAPG